MIKLFKLIIIISIQLSAAADSLDTKSFNLENYNPPTYKYHLLTIAPSFGWNHYRYSDSNQQLNKEVNSNGNANCNATHNYRNHLLMNDIDIWSEAGFEINPYSRDERKYGYEPREYSYSKDDGNLSLNFLNISRFRHYTYKRWFLEFKVTPSISNNYIPNRRTEQTSFYDQCVSDSLISHYSYSKYSLKVSNLSLSSGISIGIGRGWIKDVTAARVSQQMIDVINENDGKHHLLSSSEMQSLASYIDKLKHRRSFDSRLSEIEDIDSLMGYMLHNGIITNEKTSTIMQIDDLWRYGFNQNRRSGMEILMFPIIEGSYRQNKLESSNQYLDTNMKQDIYKTAKSVLDIPPTSVSKDEEYRRFLDYSYGMGFNIGMSRAIGRFLQFDGSVNLEGKMVTSHDSIYSIRIQGRDSINNLFYEKHPLGKIDVSLMLNWFPDTRTTITLGNSYSYLKENNYNTILYTQMKSYTLLNDSLFNNVGRTVDNTWLSVNYYISPKCSYSVGVGYSYNTLISHKTDFDYYYYAREQTINNKSNGFWINASLSYSIF